MNSAEGVLPVCCRKPSNAAGLSSDACGTEPSVAALIRTIPALPSVAEMETIPSSAATNPDVASTHIVAAIHLDVNFRGRILEPFAEGNVLPHAFVPLSENKFRGSDRRRSRLTLNSRVSRVVDLTTRTVRSCLYSAVGKPASFHRTLISHTKQNKHIPIKSQVETCSLNDAPVDGAATGKLNSHQRITGLLNIDNGLMCDLYFTSTVVPCSFQFSLDQTPKGVTIQPPFTL